MVLAKPVEGAAVAGGGKATRCWKTKGARIIMMPASMEVGPERVRLSHEIDRIIALARARGEVDPGLVRAREAIDDEKNHLMVARSRWGDLLGSLSYTLPDPSTIREEIGRAHV